MINAGDGAKSTASPLMLVNLFLPKGSYDNIFLANYAYINLNDQLTRPGQRNCRQAVSLLLVKPDRL
jgi:HAE1 family hydrophobic/amphiphilic exporter-1